MILRPSSLVRRPLLPIPPRRFLSTLPSNPHIYVHPHPASPSTHLLSLLPTTPCSPRLAIGTTTTLPPTPSSLTENPAFLALLQSTFAQHAHHDPSVIAQAQAFASTSGSTLGSGGAFFPNQSQTDKRSRKGTTYGGGGGTGGDGAGGASSQGGAGGGGRGGWVHVSDTRNPPDYGRIAWPEDIFGSVEVDARGRVEEGSYQESGTYRVCTNDGCLGLSPYLREKLVERLKEEERKGGG